MKQILSYRFILPISFSLIFSIISFQKTGAQQIKKETSGEQDKKKITLFFEKVYLHTDRTYYCSGDDIWFKAYLVNAISNIPMETSKNLYVDLISSDAKIIDHKLIHLDMGFGNGDFKLPDSIPSGTYKLRAYTNWIRNFGDIFLFEKELNVYSIPDIKPKITIHEKQKPTIQFFPESGSLIYETLNNIAFKALDENGKGCNATGAIVSSDNDTICWFKSSYLGMGTFAFLSLPDKKYYATGIINNSIPFKTELPQPLIKGYGMRIYDSDTSCFYASIYTNQATLNDNPNNQLIINCLSHNKNCFTGKFLINSENKDIRIPKKNFPGGMVSITLYDSLIRPQCQRLFYVNKKDNIHITLSTDKQVYQPREKVSVNIKVTDNDGLPVKTQLSLTATDNDMVPEDFSNIVSYLMLESEIKGKIEHPKNYFDPNNPLRFRQLDLLLLTQGWRDFLWRRVKDSIPRIKYMVEPGITLSGKVRQKLIDHPIPNADITLYIPKAKNNTFFFTKTNEDGNYYLFGIEFYGKQNLIVTTSNEKGKNKGWIFLDNPDTTRYPVIPFASATDEFVNKSKFKEESRYQNNISKKNLLTDTIQLKEIVISAAKIKEDKQIKNHIIETGSRPDYIYKIGADDYNYDLSSFLLMKVPKSRLSNDPSAVSGGPANRVLFNVSGSEQPPRFIIDGRSFKKGDLSDENFIYDIPLEGIETIMVSFTDVYSGSSDVGFSAGVAISIITNPNAFQKKNFYTTSKSLEGYYEARTFYSPLYPDAQTANKQPDLRNTIYWNPKLTTDKNGECTFTYYNTDKENQVKVSAEGLTDKGIPLARNSIYTVKK
jgi:hypothetical protein